MTTITCTTDAPDQQGGAYDCPNNVVSNEALGLLRDGVRWQLVSDIAGIVRLPVLEHTVL